MLRRDDSNFLNRNDEIDSILGKTPNKLMTWGISLIFCIVFIIFIGSYFFKMPNTIKCNIILTSSNPPLTVIAKSSGKIERFLIKDGQFVKKGELILVVENSAGYENVENVKIILDSFRLFLNNIKLDNYYNFYELPELGEIQAEFSNFIKLYKDYYYQLENEYNNKKINNINDQILNYRSYQMQLHKQEGILEKQLEIQKNEFKTDSILFSEEVLAFHDFKQSEKNLLKELFSFEELKSSINMNELQISKLEYQKLDIINNSKSILESIKNQVSESYENLQASINLWEQSYVVRATIDGKISFSNIWNLNHNITKGEKILTIVPNENPKLIGKILLPMIGIGKVKIDQIVNIKFDGYPYMEYGIVKGKIASISLVPVKENNGTFYLAEVEFPNGLTTNYGLNLEFSQQMQGSAEIITEDLRLIMKFLNPLKSIFYKNIK